MKDWGFMAVNAVCSTLKSTERLWDQLPHVNNSLCALYPHSPNRWYYTL